MLWSRAIILVDMNAFFASIEQRDRLEWRGRPLAITNGMRGTCIITSSYEARACGVKTGMHWYEAKQLCPDLIQVPAQPHRYATISSQLMTLLQTIAPDIEIFSVDEAFLEVTHCQKYLGTPEALGQLVQRKIKQTLGLPCSIGISGDKTTAKFAAKQHKPNGFTVIPPWEAKAALKKVPVTELCGIAQGIGRFLSQYGVHYCGDMERLPMSILAKRFGNLGRRIWWMCQGADPEPLQLNTKAPQSLGHSKVMPPGIQQRRVVMTYLQHMAEKVAVRLRAHQLAAKTYTIGVRTHELGLLLGNTITLSHPTQDGKTIFTAAKQIINTYWQGEPLSHVYITAGDPHPAGLQLELFAEPNHKTQQLNAVIDAINQRYGEFTLAPATLLERSDMPNVIAPSWRPQGHRQTIG